MGLKCNASARRACLLLILALQIEGLPIHTSPPPRQPTQIHLAFANGQVAPGMTISWTTSHDAPSVVRYGHSADSLQFVARGTSSNYFGQWGSWHHDVTIRGLEPGEMYHYQCGDDEIMSEVHTFKTSPPAGTYGFSVAVFGDMGTDNSATTLQRLIERTKDAEFYLHVGDVGYADDHPLTYEHTYNHYMEEVAPFASQRSYMVLPGNHEASCQQVLPRLCPKQLQNFTAYNHRFRMPSSESDSTAANMWFSFNVGAVHFVAINTETDFASSPEGEGSRFGAGGFGAQLQWLDNDLRQAAHPVNRTVRPWVVVAGHRPLVDTSAHDLLGNFVEGDMLARVRQTFEPLLQKYEVDLYIAGHSHLYQRLRPTNNGSIVAERNAPDGIPGMVVGNAGNIEGHARFNPDTDGVAISRDEKHYGYGMLDVVSPSRLSWTMYRADTNAIIDHADLHKGLSSPSPGSEQRRRTVKWVEGQTALPEDRSWDE